MKIVILGAGALGSIIGGHLARAGEEVTIIARGRRAAYVQQHGITLTQGVHTYGATRHAFPIRQRAIP